MEAVRHRFSIAVIAMNKKLHGAARRRIVTPRALRASSTDDMDLSTFDKVMEAWWIAVSLKLIDIKEEMEHNRQLAGLRPSTTSSYRSR